MNISVKHEVTNLESEKILAVPHSKFPVGADGGNLLFIVSLLVCVVCVCVCWGGDPTGGMRALCQKMTNCPFSPL